MKLSVFSAIVAAAIPFICYSADQTITVTVTQQASVEFSDTTMTNANFNSTPAGGVDGSISSTWSYFNNETSSGTQYKVTGQVSNFTQARAPKGWSLKATLSPPSDGSPFGTSVGDLISLPWSDESAADFIHDLPQARAGEGAMEIQVLVDAVSHFDSDQTFVVTWTVATE